MTVVKIDPSKISAPIPSSTTHIITDLRKQFQSSNINILLGAGFSHGVYELLGDIENELYIAEFIDEDMEKVTALKQRFFTGSILPYLDPKKKENGADQRHRFFALLNSLVSNRQSSILHKIINVFTTNYDLLIEESLESCRIKYVDGFSGRINPIFSTSNYGIIFNRQTSISSMTSEVTTFNVYKVHGSLNWDVKNDEIVFMDPSVKIAGIRDSIKTNDFEREYKRLAIINPTKEKLNQTVMNVNYYDQLRMYCNELEKNNTLLMSFGFSFADEHIRSMTLRSLQGNPTLALVIFSFSEKATANYIKAFQDCANVQIIQLVEQTAGGDEMVLPLTLERVNDIMEAVFDGTK